jgi:hypothetical protein
LEIGWGKGGQAGIGDVDGQDVLDSHTVSMTLENVSSCIGERRAASLFVVVAARTASNPGLSPQHKIRVCRK